MHIYEVVINPLSGFITSLKGDTVFGHFCWQVLYDDKLMKKSFDQAVDSYDDKPFAVFSSAFPVKADDPKCRYLPKPEYPWFTELDRKGITRKQKIEGNKKLKKKKWITVKNYTDLLLNPASLRSDEDITGDEDGVVLTETRTRNTINRLSSTTSGSGFDPYPVDMFSFSDHIKLCLICIADPEYLEKDAIQTVLERIGSTGFGKDASSGMGRFQVESVERIEKPEPDTGDLCYTFAPMVPRKGDFKELYFKPFTRFGKHGGLMARSENPFKRPVIMADEGAVAEPVDGFPDTPYIGRAVTGASFIEPRTIVQGYAPWMPIKTGA